MPAPQAPAFQGTTQFIRVHKSVRQHNSGGVSSSQRSKIAWIGGEGLTGRAQLRRTLCEAASLERRSDP